MDTALTFKNILCTGKEAHIMSNYNKYSGMIEKVNNGSAEEGYLTQPRNQEGRREGEIRMTDIVGYSVRKEDKLGETRSG